jgi:hypothetical protein
MDCEHQQLARSYICYFGVAEGNLLKRGSSYLLKHFNTSRKPPKKRTPKEELDMNGVNGNWVVTQTIG